MFWNRQSLFAQQLDVLIDGFADELHDFLTALGRRDATRQVRHVGTVSGLSAFDYNGVSHIVRSKAVTATPQS